MIVDIFHHQEGLLLRWIGVGDRWQTDQIDVRVVACRTFAGEEDHLAGHFTRPGSHHCWCACGEKVLAGHHRDENQLLLLGDARKIDRGDRDGNASIRMIDIRAGGRGEIIGDTTFDIAEKNKTRLKANRRGDKQEDQGEPP